MSRGLFEQDLFYSVKPGDTLEKIARRRRGAFGAGEVHQEAANLLKLNPQIKNPDRIYPGNLIYLGSFEGTAKSAPSEFDLHDADRLWCGLSPETRKVVESHFDLLEWLSTGLSAVDALHTFGDSSLSTLRKVEPFVSELSTGTVRVLEQTYEEIFALRRETILILSRFQVTLREMPVLFLRIRPNGFYGFSQALKRVVEIAEHIKLGKRLLLADAILETADVVRTGFKTHSVEETAKQAGRNGIKFGIGLGGGVISGKICLKLIPAGPWGWGGCAATLAVSYFGGNYIEEFLGEKLIGPPRVIPQIH